MGTLSRRSRSVLISAAAAILAIIATTPAPAHAAPPPSGYPTGTIIQTTHNSKLGLGIPLRRGFFDAAAQKGFGWDKVWNYHNTTTLKAVANLSKSTNTTVQGTTVLLKTWAYKIKRTALSCQTTHQQEVRLVFVTNNPGTYSYKASNPTRLIKVSTGATNQSWGVQTAYCILSSGVRCPDWVTYSLTNPGKANPLRTSTPDVDGTPASAAPSQTELGESDEEAIEEADDSTTDEYSVFSYEPIAGEVEEAVVQQAQDEGLPLNEVE